MKIGSTTINNCKIGSTQVNEIRIGSTLVWQFSSLDPDAQAFITAAGITNPTQQTAINTLVVSLKAYGIWTKMKALYPFVGGTAFSHKFNLKNPADTNAAFRLVFNGGWTHSANGAQPNGTNGFANTFLNDNTSLALNSAHISIYSRTNVDALYCDMGMIDGSFESTIFSKFGNVFYPRIHATNSGISNTSSSLGHFIANRISSTEIRARQNGVLKQITNASVVKNNSVFYIGAANSPFPYYSPRQYAFSSIGDGLTDTEAANLYTAVQTFQTTLGRNV